MPLTIAPDGTVTLTFCKVAPGGPLHVISDPGEPLVTTFCRARYVPLAVSRSHSYPADRLLAYTPDRGDCPACIAAMQAEIRTKLQEAHTDG